MTTEERLEAMYRKLDKNAINLWLNEDTNGGLLEFEDVMGNRYNIPVDRIQKHEECYHANRGNRRLLRISSIPPVFRIVNARIDKNGVVHPRRETQKYAEDIELWNKIKRYNSKARMIRIGQLNIINDKPVYIVDNDTVEARIPPIVTNLPVLARQGGGNVEKIVIQGKVSSIPNKFATYMHVKEVVLNPELTSIGTDAFLNCRELEKINIPKNVKRIGNRAFCYDKKLKEVKFNGPLFYLGSSAFAGCNSLEEIVIPNGIPAIAENTFSMCDNLRHVFIPKSVKTVDPSAFKYTLGHLTITAPEHLCYELQRSGDIRGRIKFYPG